MSLFCIAAKRNFQHYGKREFLDLHNHFLLKRNQFELCLNKCTSHKHRATAMLHMLLFIIVPRSMTEIIVLRNIEYDNTSKVLKTITQFKGSSLIEDILGSYRHWSNRVLLLIHTFFKEKPFFYYFLLEDKKKVIGNYLSHTLLQ